MRRIISEFVFVCAGPCVRWGSGGTHMSCGLGGSACHAKRWGVVGPECHVKWGRAPLVMPGWDPDPHVMWAGWVPHVMLGGVGHTCQVGLGGSHMSYLRVPLDRFVNSQHLLSTGPKHLLGEDLAPMLF